jgi:hypothetical protein
MHALNLIALVTSLPLNLSPDTSPRTTRIVLVPSAARHAVLLSSIAAICVRMFGCTQGKSPLSVDIVARSSLLHLRCTRIE